MRGIREDLSDWTQYILAGMHTSSVLHTIHLSRIKRHMVCKLVNM